MVTTVGQDIIKAKRDLRDIFPKEFANRLLINEFITYILNNFFEKSNEKIVSAYVGEVVPSVDGMECYVKEPTIERQMNQIIPILNDGSEYITYSNFIADLHNEGCKIFDENKLLASKYWSWCPPINVDMFINTYNYYWIGWDYGEKNMRILRGEIDVSQLIGTPNPVYNEYTEEGAIILDKQYEFKNGDRVVFTNDISNKYNNIPYIVSGLTYTKDAENNDINDGKGYFKLTAVKMPLIVLDSPTNVAVDVEGQKSYTFKDEKHNLEFDFQNGMRIMFLNDSNVNYNNITFMVTGVGSSIKMIDDTYDPYASLYETDNKKYNKLVTKPDYFVMERGCSDGNDWSVRNRWVHVKALEVLNIDSISTSDSSRGLYHASKPILCYNKDIKLYNYGTFDRGYVVAITEKQLSEINNQFKSNVLESLKITDLKTGDNILFKNIESTNPIQIYTTTIVTSKSGIELVTLKACTNGQEINGKTSNGATVKGDIVKKIDGIYNTPYYYDGYSWVEGQKKNAHNLTDDDYNGINQNPLFDLFDADKVKLDNSVTYPNSTFNGCKLFDYKEATVKDGVYSGDEYDAKGNIVQYGLDRFILNEDEDKNYIFDNHLHTDVFTYTPPMDYEHEISGYKFFKINNKEEYYNDWYLSSSKYNQYIKTQIEANDATSYVEIDEDKYYKVTLKYLPSETTTKKSLNISINGEYVIPENIKQDGYDVYIKGVKEYDTLIFNILTDEDIEDLDPNYTFEPPLSLTTNQFNHEIETIGYNNCFDQMIDIMENQAGFEGRANGSNNYSSLNPDLSVGTKIIQTASNIIRTMILDNDTNTTIRSSIKYAENAYIKFKNKFSNMLDQYYIKGEITDDMAGTYQNNEEQMDEIIINIINSINIGKEGLLPFYNNGVTHLIENAYIPATPAYLGIANNYEPKIKVYDEYTGETKPSVIIGHDGSLTKAYGNVKDLFLLRLETLIYSSINTKFKDTRCGINKYEFLPGYFRTRTYTRDELINTYSTFVDLWANENGLDYSENLHFDYDLTANPEAWKTWNYTNTYTPDGEELKGSYRAVYTYYYDTHRPDTHPWEMLGFSDEPSWWETEYGSAPFTASNIVMWRDIENGIIKNGEWAGEYEELKRPGLIEKYLPVDNNGKLKSPMDIGIIDYTPTIQTARARWRIGDMGDVEFAYMQTSSYRFSEQLVLYLLRPVSWVESNWNTLDTITLFKGTDYEQTINSITEARENISETIMHNELVDGEYVRNIGIQQWISDYALSNNLSITDIANKIRKANVNLGYRCSGFYEKDTVTISTDTYGIIPEENVHINLFKSKDNKTLTYSAMSIIKTKKGYMIDGFDKSFPYFMVRVPEINGKKAAYSSEGSSNVISASSYIVPNSVEFSRNWLSATKGGEAITPAENKVYRVVTDGKYKNKLFIWNGSNYSELSNINNTTGLTVYYPLAWKDEVQKVPYRKEFTTVQEVYNVINGYGKYLEENENWYFNTRNSSGVVMNWRTSSESFVDWASAQKGNDTEGNLLLLNPGVIGLGNYNVGMVEDLHLKNCGYNPVLDIYGNPIDADKLNVFRQSFNTYIQPKEDNIALIKLRTYELEHLLVLDNETIYGDVIYDSRYYTILGRFKIFGVKVKNWYGTIYAPGYLLENGGAIPNFDKAANDLQYIFRVDDAKCQSEKAEYSRAIVGYNKTKTYVDLFRNDKAMFDFYKGAIRQKGTKTVIDKMNRSSYVSSTGNNIEIYENWLFKAGEFGHTRDNSVLEFILDMKKMRENPQVITFESSNNYYYDENQTYNIGNVVIYHNYEYSCLNNNVTGEFNLDDWKQLRYIGNYIIFGNDKKWIKKQRNPLEQCFSYTDSLLVNPIGGFAQLNDVEYIVANEEEFESTKDSMAIGETVWIVKVENGDWDIRKKTGVNKFVSMRYPTLEDAYKKPAFEHVYHFTDDKKDYYTNVTSETIDDNPLTPLYSDIDMNNYACRWCDIGSPMYTGETGQYVTGTDYKVKLYNTVFKTMVPESNVNNSTTLRDLGNDTSITYSNLLLNMTQFGIQYHKYKWRMSLNVITNSPNVVVNINGQEYNDEYFEGKGENKVDIIVCEGDTITWKATAYGCGSKTETFYIPYTPKGVPDTVSSLPTTDLYNGRCVKYNNIYYSYQSGYGWIELGENTTDRKLDITVKLSFRDKTVLANQSVAETKEILFCNEGSYEVKLVGAGGGAGGGELTIHKKKHGHLKHSTYSYVYYGGCAGAGGAYVSAVVPISEQQVTSNNNNNHYYITCGAGGLGGAFRCDGNNGIDSTLYNNNTLMIQAQAGAAGAAALKKGDKINNGRTMGYGGTYYINSAFNITTNKAIVGNNGGTGSYQGNYGHSVYPGSTYGQGGNYVVGKAGKSGYNGYIQVIYKKGENYDDYSTISTKETKSPISVELGESDSMEYTSYYQPFVLPSTESGVTYFYSYDVLYKDETRPNANILGSGTQFYLNRSKAITGFHKSSIIKNLWTNTAGVKYSAGDLVTARYEDCAMKAYIVSTSAYIVSDSTAFSAGWLSSSASGSAFTPATNTVYRILTDGAYKNKYYVWNGSSYVEASTSTYSNWLKAGWLSATNGGSALTPKVNRVYIIDSSGSYKNKYYVWNGEAYEQESDNYAYFICTEEHISDGKWHPKTESDKGLWTEYTPTYYYKIDYNNGIGNTAPNTLLFELYSNSKTYNENDIVKYENNAYICKDDEVQGVLPTNNEKWDRMEDSRFLKSWVRGENYSAGSLVRYDDECYECITATTSDSVPPSTSNKWKKIKSIYRYNIELYIDSQCTERATKDSTSSAVEDRVMTVNDLKPGYNVGLDYTLVNPFATYQQLTPRYISEPSWGDIGQTGTYDVTSGGISYYSKLDKETTVEDESSLMYSDERCLTPVKSIDVDSNEEGTKLTYTEVDMKYTDLTEVVSDHHETSYEMKDNDLYLYTNKTITEIVDETPVYSEFELQNEIGTYGDYVPHWTKISYIPNSFINTVKYIDYDLISSSTSDVKNYSIQLYSDSDKTVGIDLYYKEENKFKHFYTPATCNDDGFVPYNLYLYYINKPENVVETTLPEYSADIDNQIFKVLKDRDGKTNYYRATISGWNFLGDINQILAESDTSTFNRYGTEEEPGPVYVKVAENTSIMYAESDYNGNVINQNTSLLINNVNNSIKLYFDKQMVGNYINSNGIIIDTENKEEISIMFTNMSEDPMIGILTTIDSMIINPHDVERNRQIIRNVVNLKNSSSFFVDLNEVMAIYEKTAYNSATLEYEKTFFKPHTCKVFDSYRNKNGSSKEYYKLYQYGSKLYYGINVINNETGNNNFIGITAGNVEELTTYNKMVGVPENTEDKIVNIITYKEFGDYLYITHDSYRSRYSLGSGVICDTDNVSKVDGTYGLESDMNLRDKKGWMKIEYIDKDYMFDLISAQRLRINTDIIKSCYLVDNYDDSTIVKVQVFDPIQNIIPNNTLDEVNYISSTDPVNDYNDVGKWNDNKIGYLWWDTSKVRYVDYYQGDYEYRRITWGKQLPGSEIVINEWTRNVEAPTDGREYVTRTLFDNELDTNITYYYYWEKNPVEIPDVSFRKTPALTIAAIINNPTEEGIVWMSPIDSNINGKGENTLVLCNYNNVITGQEAVLQINLDSDNDVLDHTEWVQVKENTNADIPEFLWEKMRDSLLGYKVIDGEEQPVPSADLTGRQRLGISFRPRQTMFDKLYNARENFVDIINDIFSSRTYEQINNDMSSWLIKYNPEYPVVDEPNEEDYFDEADTKLEMMSWRDEGLIGQTILVKNDETLDGIWAIYRINNGWTYTLVDYQKYNMNNYLTLTDWYDNNDIKYLTPTWTVSSTSIDAIALCKTLTEGKMVKFVDGSYWELYQLINNDGVLEVKLVGKANTIIHISESLYDYVNEGINDTDPYIVLEDGTVLTKFEYKRNETEYLIKMLIEYFDI